MEIKHFGVYKYQKKYTNRNGSYLLALNDDFLFPIIKSLDGYFLIGGGIEEGEIPINCLERECKEEISAIISNAKLVCKTDTFYDLNNCSYHSENFFYYSNVDFLSDEREEGISLKWLTFEDTISKLALEHQKWAVKYFYDHFNEFEFNNNILLDSWYFIKALKFGDSSKLKEIPKSDLHNHAPFGGSQETFFRITGHEANPVINQFKNFEEMIRWCDENISRKFNTREGYLQRIQAAFIQASKDGIKKLCLNFGVCTLKYFDSAYDMIKCINDLKNKYFKNGIFLPELCLDREKISEKYIKNYYDLLNLNYFKSIDLTGRESFPIEPLIPLFREAERKNLILKAHVGEFSDAETVIRTIDMLHLTQIQHGISIAESEKAIRYVRNHSIQLNIAPSSNYYLKRIDVIKNHPIKLLFNAGVKVTINTDDVFIFNSTINNEYLLLFKSGVLSAEQLNQIRLNGLND